MILSWEILDPERALKAEAPLFGSIRVERYSTDSDWQVNWSVPGYCNTLIEGGWPSALDAQRAAEEFVERKLIDVLTQEPVKEDGLPGPA